MLAIAWRRQFVVPPGFQVRLLCGLRGTTDYTTLFRRSLQSRYAHSRQFSSLVVTRRVMTDSFPSQMLSSDASRRAIAQLNLIFTDLPLPETQLWEQFDQTQKQVLIEILTRLMVKAARTSSSEETHND